MSQIHILDGQENIILDYITAKNIISDLHKKSLEDTLETYDFITFANRRFSQYLEKRNRIIIPDEDGTLVEFVIFEAAKYKDTEGHKAQVYTNASYLELKKAAIIYPESFKGSPSQHTGRALNNTGWQVGKIEGTGSRTIIVENHTNPYEILKRIAREFELELKFRIEHDGNKVTGRYVDLLERVGQWRGREVEFGKDLDGIRRVEKQDIVTALLGIGPEMEDGSRIEVLVEDQDALRRWGEIKSDGGLRHLIEPYEIQSERTEMTEAEVRQYTRTALNKRIDTQVTYETTIVDLESVPGMENKKIRFGDTIRIKDTSFNPPLYLEARVFEQTRSIKFVGKKDIKLGDFVEFTEEQVNNIWKQLQQQIQRRVTQYEMHEYTYEKIMIDQKDQTVFDEGKTFAEAIGIESKDYADSKDAVVRVELEEYSERISEQYAESALEQAKMYAVSQEFYEAQMENIVRDISDRAPIEYVDGQIRVIKGNLDDFDAKLEQKADGSTVYTIDEVDTMINNTVSRTQYTADMDGIVQNLESYGTRIGQNENAIGLKADDSRLDTVEQELNTKIGNLEVRADEVVISVSEVRADLNHKVDGVYVADAIDGIQVGGRNIAAVNRVDTNLANLNDYVYRLTKSSGSSNPYLRISREYFDTDSDYVATFKVRKISGTVFSMAGHFISFNGGTTYRDGIEVSSGSWNVGDQNYPDDTETHQYEVHFRTPASFPTDSAPYWYIQPNRSAYGQDYVLEIWDFQIEKGNKSTDWTPAPEDTDAQFSDVYGRVETLDASINTMAGEIELKASQSVVDTLTGNVETLEAELRVLPDTITLDASRINFDGHVFGENATFSGNLQGATGSFVSDENDGNRIEVASGAISSYHNNRMMVQMYNYNMFFYDSGTNDPSPDYGLVGDIGVVWRSSDPSERGFGITSHKERMSISFSTSGTTRSPIALWKHEDRSGIIAGATSEDWTGQLELRSSFTDREGNSYVPKLYLNNRTIDDTRWGNIVAYVGRNNNSPTSNSRYGFEVWQYQGTGDGSATQIFNTDYSTHYGNYSTEIADQLSIGYSNASNERIRIKYDPNGDSSFSTLGTDNYWNTRMKFPGRGSSRVDFPYGLGTSSWGTGRGFAIMLGSGLEHVVTANADTNIMTLYPQRYSGEDVFKITSHHQKGSFRDDLRLSISGTLYVPATYGNTTTNSANIRVGTSAGHFTRNTSLRKYKLNIESAKDPYKILNLEARTWYDKGDVERYCEAMTKKNSGEDYDLSNVEYIKRIGGLVAEEVVEAGLEIYAEYDENGNLNGVAYDRAWTLLIPITRDHHREISELKTENQFLHNEIIKLKEQIA